MVCSDSFTFDEEEFKRRKSRGRTRSPYAKNYSGKHELFTSKTYKEYVQKHIMPDKQSEMDIVRSVVEKLHMRKPTLSELMAMTVCNEPTGNNKTAAAALAFIRHELSNYEDCIRTLKEHGLMRYAFLLKIAITEECIKTYPTFEGVGVSIIQVAITEQRKRNNPVVDMLLFQDDWSVDYKVWERA